MAAIIGDILDFSRIESGQMNLDLEEVSLEGILENYTQQFKEEAAQKNLIFHLPKLSRDYIILEDRRRIT